MRRQSSQLMTDKPAAEWGVEEVLAWLGASQFTELAKYQQLFVENEVDGAKLLTLDNNDALKNIGVTSVGHRTMLRKMVKELAALDDASAT